MLGLAVLHYINCTYMLLVLMIRRA